MKHTKGPWGLMPNNPNQITDMVGHSDPLYLAEVNGNDQAENRANARLIAAAPELLDVLRRILSAHDSGNNGAVMGEAVLCQMFSEMARAAIRKATEE